MFPNLLHSFTPDIPSTGISGNCFGSEAMKSKIVILFFILIVANSCFFCCVDAATELSNDEWTRILAIGDEKDVLTGAHLILNIEPDKYYQERGSEIVLSGSFKGIFGPLGSTPLIIERINATNDTYAIETETDENGIYSLTDILADQGTYTYQTLFNPADSADTRILKSNRLEVSSGRYDESILSSGLEVNRTSEEMPLVLYQDSKNLSFLLFCENTSFIPGEIMNLSGNLTSDSRPVPYVQVYAIPEIQRDEKVSGPPIEGLTRSDGTVNFSFHLTGTEPVSWRLEYPENRTKLPCQSNTITLMPMATGMNPPARIADEIESIDIYLDNEYAKALQNITIYGWYNGKKGNGMPLHTLEPIWYNFGGKIWDRYQNSSQILTNADGMFECRVQAPQTPGTYLVGVKKSGSTTKAQVYSNILALTVTSPDVTGEEHHDNSPQPHLSLQAFPASVQVSDQLEIKILYENSDADILPDMPLLLYYSDNNIEWKPISGEELRLSRDRESIVTIQPEKPGYWYFRAVLGDPSLMIAESDILVVPVLS